MHYSTQMGVVLRGAHVMTGDAEGGWAREGGMEGKRQGEVVGGLRSRGGRQQGGEGPHATHTEDGSAGTEASYRWGLGWGRAGKCRWGQQEGKWGRSWLHVGGREVADSCIKCRFSACMLVNLHCRLLVASLVPCPCYLSFHFTRACTASTWPRDSTSTLLQEQYHQIRVSGQWLCKKGTHNQQLLREEGLQ